MKGIRSRIIDLKRYIKDVRNIPGTSLGQMADYFRKNYGFEDRFFKAVRTLELLDQAQKNGETYGWKYATEEAMNETGIDYTVQGEENIPHTGSLVFVANHPYGALEIFALADFLLPVSAKTGSDFKVLTGPKFKILEGIKLLSILNNGNGNGKGNNGYEHSLEEHVRSLQQGGNLVILPAGDVSGAHLEEYPWKNGVGYLAPHSQYIVPIYVSGPDHSFLYNFLSNHERTEELRNGLIPRETWNKSGKSLDLIIGEPIDSKRLSRFRDRKKVTAYLKEKTEALRPEA